MFNYLPEKRALTTLYKDWFTPFIDIEKIRAYYTNMAKQDFHYAPYANCGMFITAVYNVANYTDTLSLDLVCLDTSGVPRVNICSIAFYNILPVMNNCGMRQLAGVGYSGEDLSYLGIQSHEALVHKFNDMFFDIMYNWPARLREIGVEVDPYRGPGMIVQSNNVKFPMYRYSKTHPRWRVVHECRNPNYDEGHNIGMLMAEKIWTDADLIEEDDEDEDE